MSISIKSKTKNVFLLFSFSSLLAYSWWEFTLLYCCQCLSKSCFYGLLIINAKWSFFAINEVLYDKKNCTFGMTLLWAISFEAFDTLKIVFIQFNTKTGF